MSGWRTLCFFLVLALAIPVLAADEEEDLQQNKRLLQKWKQDPEHYARLLADLKAFHELSRARQEQLRQFDSNFAALDLKKQSHLWEVLERYNYWLEHLPEADRQRILQTTDMTERLTLIRQIRAREWQDRLPAHTREELKAALARAPDADKQAEILASFQKQDSERHARLVRQAKQTPQTGPLRPARTGQLPGDLKSYLDNQLKPQLNKEERNELEQAEGKYPQLLQTLHKLGEAHPVLLPQPKAAVYNYQTLPQEYQKAFPQPKLKFAGLLGPDRYNWPLFALTVNQYARKELPKDYATLPPLGASQPSDFPPGVKIWIERVLFPRLKLDEKNSLQADEKKWPEYPLKLHKLAREHKIPLPQPLNLPGPKDMWDAALGIMR
jgi:hypothetical protein